jgi:hypothetical protein
LPFKCNLQRYSEWGFNVVQKDADAPNIGDGMTAGGALDARLAERGLGELSYYDGMGFINSLQSIVHFSGATFLEPFLEPLFWSLIIAVLNSLPTTKRPR